MKSRKISPDQKKRDLETYSKWKDSAQQSINKRDVNALNNHNFLVALVFIEQANLVDEIKEDFKNFFHKNWEYLHSIRHKLRETSGYPNFIDAISNFFNHGTIVPARKLRSFEDSFENLQSKKEGGKKGSTQRWENTYFKFKETMETNGWKGSDLTSGHNIKKLIASKEKKLVLSEKTCLKCKARYLKEKSS